MPKMFKRFAALIADLLDGLDRVSCAACQTSLKRSDANHVQMTTGSYVYLCDCCYAKEFAPWSQHANQK